MPTTRTKKADTGGAPAEKAKKPLGRKSTPAVKARKAAPAKPASKKRTLAVVHADATPAPRRGGRYLVVVESPAKAKTIKKYLGAGYAVKASVGHVKDLPKSKMGVDVEHDFTPEYHVIHEQGEGARRAQEGGRGRRAGVPGHRPRSRGRGHRLAHRRGARVTPTRSAGAVQRDHQEGHPGGHRAPADARPGTSTTRSRPGASSIGSWATRSRPLLWKKVRRGLSAGRVQSVAVRLIVEREREIKAFVPVEYWTLEAELEGKSPPPFRARLAKLDGKKAEVPDRATADALAGGARKARLPGRHGRASASAAATRPRRSSPASCSRRRANRLHFTAKKTMTLAQRLYEGVELGDEGADGAHHLHAHRLDAPLGRRGDAGARRTSPRRYGKEYAARRARGLQEPRRARRTRTRPSARRRWSGRPSGCRPFLEPDMCAALRADLEPLRRVPDEARGLRPDDGGDLRGARDVPRRGLDPQVRGLPGGLRRWRRPPTRNRTARSRATTRTAGRRGERPAARARRRRPAQARGQELLPEQHFTQPPPRFTEASLVKELEEKGIGRPSTYAVDPLGHPGEEVRREDRGSVPSRPSSGRSPPRSW